MYLHSIANQSGNPRVSALPLDQVLVTQRAKVVQYTYIVFRGISPSLNAMVNGENANILFFLAHEEKFSKSIISVAEENAECRFIGQKVMLLGGVELNLEGYPFSVPFRQLDIISQQVSIH